MVAGPTKKPERINQIDRLMDQTIRFGPRKSTIRLRVLSSSPFGVLVWGLGVYGPSAPPRRVKDQHACMEKSKVDSFGHSFACLLLRCLKPVALSFVSICLYIAFPFFLLWFGFVWGLLLFTALHCFDCAARLFCVM